MSATVAFSVTSNGELILGTSEASHKSQNVDHDNRVAVTVTDPDRRHTMQMQGTARKLSREEFEAEYAEEHYRQRPQSLPFKDDKQAADAFDLLGRIEMLTKRIRGALYARAAERPIALNDGRVFGPVEKLSATEIDIDKAHRLLLDKFGPQIANDCVTKTMSQAGIERALKKHGHAGLVKDVKRALADSGAAKRETKTSIEVHDAK